MASTMASSSDLSLGAMSPHSSLSPEATRHSFMNRSAAVAQDLACAEGTRGGYWNVVESSANAGLPSSIVATLLGLVFQLPSKSKMSPSIPRTSLVHRSIS